MKYLLPSTLCLVVVTIVMASVIAHGQSQQVDLSIKSVVQLAQSQAPDVLIAETRLSNSYWQYQSFKANYRPLIALEGNLPAINRSIESITIPDGSETFIQRSFMRNSMGISLAQDVALTGGSVFVSTNLNRLDVFETAISPASISYLSTPVTVGFVQPFFQFNRLKWDQKTEPLRYEEAQSVYSEELESIAYDAILFFFDVYRSQAILDGAITDKNNADTLYNISKGRFEVGRIAETELLQLELQSMNADDAIAEATLQLQSSTEVLRNFLGIKTKVEFRPSLPDDLPNISIDPVMALEYANRYRSQTFAFRRRLLEAEREVDQAEKNNGFTVDLTGSIGLTQTAPDLFGAYNNPLSQEQVSLRLRVPIADWGKARSRRETARSNRDLIFMQVEQDQVSFEQQVLLSVQQFELIKNRVTLARKSLEVAQKKQELTRGRYLIGKIGITDFNQSLIDLDRSRRSFIESQRDFWVAYYTIRGLTLYDWENDRPLIVSSDEDAFYEIN